MVSGEHYQKQHALQHLVVCCIWQIEFEPDAEGNNFTAKLQLTCTPGQSSSKQFSHTESE